MRVTWKNWVAGGVFVAGIGAAPHVAHATPYAYATNDITNLTLTTSAGALALVGTPVTTVSDGASYTGYMGISNVNNGEVGSPVNVMQAYAGPSIPPAENSFGALGSTSFVGTRGDAAISGGSAASGGVTVQNVAEAFGNALGRSNGSNTASINFVVAVNSPEALMLSFEDVIDLIASTADNTGENATAAITNSFQVTSASGGSPLFTYAPTALNATVASLAGSPFNNSDSLSGLYSFTTPTLAAGSYDVSLTSLANATITPGSSAPTPVPEPPSLALLGAGVFGLGLVISRHNIIARGRSV